MSFSDLPREILIHIDRLLPQASLNSLLLVRHSIAILLTPLLYTSEFPFKLPTSPTQDSCRFPTLLGSNHQARVYRCAMRWDSDMILRYFNGLSKAIFERETSAGDTLLHQIDGECNTALFDIIVGKGVSVNSTNAFGDPPLCTAIQRLDITLINRPIVSDADATIQDQWGGTILAKAIDTGVVGNVEIIINAIEAQGSSIASSKMAIMDYIYDWMGAADISIFGLLLDRGVEPSWEDGFGRSLLNIKMLHHEDYQVCLEPPWHKFFGIQLVRTWEAYAILSRCLE